MTNSPIPQETREISTTQSDITKFYAHKNVLITGTSGFLGKVILWKLFDTCKDIGKIYLLIRSKNGASAEKRLASMLKEKPFSLKFTPAQLLTKIVAIESDLTLDNLGLSPTNRKLLEENVNIVLHSAASVKFDAPLKDNLRDNYEGTKSIVELCDRILNLKAFVHVSTAYSNCHKDDISESLLPLKTEYQQAVKTIKGYRADTCNVNQDKFLEGRPNTYTYTKALAEHLVASRETQYPISIVRPSIVISSAEEPCPGWVDNVNGIAGLGCLAAIGVLRTIDWNYYATSDMVPVDYVANCIICAAYQVAENSPKKMLIYNMTSGNLNPVSWGVFFEMLRETAVQSPPTKIVRPMIQSPKHKRANPITFWMTRVFSELVFAYFVDMILTLLGYKKIMVKITSKMHHGYRILRPFTSKQWNFMSNNVIDLSESLNDMDKSLFKFDMRHVDWQKQAQVTWAGARHMILKEEPTKESISLGKSRQTLVTFIHYALMVLFMVVVAYAGIAGNRLMRTVLG